MSGVVNAVHVNVGDEVEAGTLLAQLDTRDLTLAVRTTELLLHEQQTRFNQITAPARPEDLALAEAQLTAAQASANAAYATVPSDSAEAISALQVQLAQNLLWQAQLQRDVTLSVNPEFRNTRNQSAGAQAIQLNGGLVQLELGVQVAEANAQAVSNQGPNLSLLGQANAAITQAQLQLDLLTSGADTDQIRLAEIALEVAQTGVEQSQLLLDDASLTAPFAGVITTQHLVVGQIPSPAQPALILADTSRLTVEFLVDETDVVYLGVGQQVSTTFDALPGVTVEGQITAIGILPVAEALTPQYHVTVLLDVSDVPIRIGMTASASFATAFD
jgi:HlyD family secretion protein